MALPKSQSAITTPPQGGTDQALRQAVIAGDEELRRQLVAQLQIVEDRLEQLGKPPKRRLTLPRCGQLTERKT